METSANFDLDAASHDFEDQIAAAKLILTFLLPHKHKLELGFVRIIVDLLGKYLVSLVTLNRNVVWNPGFDIHDVSLESLSLQTVLLFQFFYPQLACLVEVSHLLEEFNARLVGLVALFLKLHDVVRGCLYFSLQLIFVIKQAHILSFELIDFLHEKNINNIVRQFLIPHLFKFGNVNRLLATHFFEHTNVGSLLNTHFFQTSVVCLRSLQLLLKHGNIGLQTHVDLALSLDLCFNCLQMLKFDELRLQSALLIRLGDLARLWRLALSSLFASRDSLVRR